MNIGYFTVSSRSESAFIDYSYLASLEAEKETAYLRHIRLPKPATVIMDGRKSVSLVIRPGWEHQL